LVFLILPEMKWKKKFNIIHADDMLYAFSSENEAQEVKKQLIKKGFKFINDCNSGQIIFCFTNISK